MSTPYVGQLLLAAFGQQKISSVYVSCNGQTMQVSSNQALFSLLGTTFGGNGIQTFLLPNLQGRTPVGVGALDGNTINWGQAGGEETHLLIEKEVPQHNHALNVVAGANATQPTGHMLASGGAAVYASPTNPGAMNPGTLSTVGSSQAHENRQPFLVMNWLIALTGIFPSRI
jgi:microcystin-dependent protein